MTNDEAKFMLQGYRPNGRDAENPEFAEALAQAQRDPRLRDWFAREQAFDAVIAGKLRTVAVPDGLRESILAGTRLSSTAAAPTASKAWWRQPWSLGLAVAAAVAVMLTLLWQRPGQQVAALPGMDAILKVALADYHGAHPNTQHADAYGEFGAWLQAPTTKLAEAEMPVPVADLKHRGCRRFDIAGHEVLEICFQRETGWYHVYIAPREGFDSESLHRKPMFHEQGEFVAASWVDDTFVYVVSSTTGLAALRSIL